MHKQILDQLNEPVLFFNSELELTYINIAGEMLFGDSARHLTGSSAKKLFKRSSPEIISDLEKCLATKETLVERGLNLELSFRTVSVNFSAIPITVNNLVTNIIVELQSVDRHLKISREEQLMAQQSTARMLVRGLAHEIKNPLGGLRGAAQLLDMELSNPELKEYTEIIISESDRLQNLMDRMLGPNTPPKKIPVNIHEILERVRQLVQAETSDEISFIQNYDPSIPEIMADHNMLIQVLLNITRNAVQALDGQGKITLKTRIKRHMTINRKHHKLVLRIDVIDNGPGIEKKMITQIFYPMITGRADGTGLGLSIAHSLINQHNGLIECNSSPENTVFSIYLPVENGHE